MYEITIKGNSLEELKTAIVDIHFELCESFSGGRERNHSFEKEEESLTVPHVQQSGRTTRELELITPEVVTDEYGRVLDNITTPPTTPQVNSNVEKDSNNIPWDVRIHTGKKSFVKDGTWKLKRGVDANLVAQVKSELLSNVQQPIVAVPALPGSIVTLPPAVNEPIITAPAPVIPQMNSGHTFETFSTQFAMIIGSLITDKKITAEYVEQLKSHFGVDQIWQVTEDQKTEMFNSFSEHGLIQKV